MIKLIATDMDGTLLDDNKQLPKNFDNIVKRLFNKNIRFVISSGRSYCTLKKQFSEYLDDMTFICDNGAYVVDKGKLLSVSVLPKDTVKEAVRFCDKLGLTVLLCGKNGTWHNSRNDSQHQEIASYRTPMRFSMVRSAVPFVTPLFIISVQYLPESCTLKFSPKRSSSLQ